MHRFDNYRGCFVTGTDTGVGKTLTSAALLHWCTARGLRSVGYKPVAAGTQWAQGAWMNEDVRLLHQASSIAVSASEVGPLQLAQACAPHIAAAAQGLSIDVASLLAQAQALAQRADVLIVEGAGGFCVPLSAQQDTADLALALGLPVVLVVGLRLGCINHALLTAEAVRARKLVLAGWVGSTLSAHMPYVQENIKTLHDELQRRHAAPCLGVVPYLDKPQAEHIATYLNSAALESLFQTRATDPAACVAGAANGLGDIACTIKP